MPDPRPVVVGASPQRTDRLDSWKEIAAYLGRDVTTVQRWEKKEGLPVHRKIHDKQGSVYAFKAELDAWWQPAPSTEVTGQHGGSGSPTPPTVRGGIAPKAHAVLTARGIAVMVGLLASTLAIGTMAWRYRVLPASPIRSVAVMPLANQSGDPDQAYFVDGMHDALVLQLSKLPRLKVVSGRAARQSGTAGEALEETVRTLGVDGLLDGSVLQSGNTVRVTLRLVDARSGEIVWARAYEHPLTDVLSLHAAVATDLASQINLQLMPAESQEFSTRPRVDPEAYRLALQAEFYLSKRDNLRFLDQAQRLFQRALEVDPQDAMALAGLASTLSYQGNWNGRLPPAAVYTQARAFVERALAINPNSADAYYTLAQIRFYFEWDWPGAGAAFRRGAELDGRSTRGRIAHANYLAAIGRLEEAVAMSRETRLLAPFVPLAHQELGHDLLLCGRFAEAVPFYEEALRLEPTMLSARWQLAYIDLRRGAVASGIEAISAMRAVVGNQASPTRLAQIGHMFGRLGQRDEALAVLDVLHKRGEAEFVPRSALGLVLIGLGETEQALDELEHGYDQRDTFLVWLHASPMFDPLRGHPRFERLVQRMHFPG